MAIPTLLLLSLLVSTSIAVDPCADPSSDGTELSIFHIYGKCSPFSPPTKPSSWFNSVLDMAQKDPARVTYLSSLLAQKTTKVPIASGQPALQSANYILRVKLGTPGQLMFMVLDTSSDAAWVPCSGCTGCSSITLFSPTTSTTYGPVDCASPWCTQFKGLSCTAGPSPCQFNQTYGGDSTFWATLSQDSLRLALDIVPKYTFGCVNWVGGGISMPKQGLLGLGRGPNSLLSQTGPLYQGVFSYCLPSFRSYYFSGSLKLGRAGQPRITRSTPLLRNPHRPSLYYVNLTGIRVGRTPVWLPPGQLGFNPVTGAGTVVDSGTVISRFVGPVYVALRDEFRRQVNASEYKTLGAFDTCFVTMARPTPTVTLHFEGMELVLPIENTVIHSSATPVACLGMAASPANVNAVVNVIANLQQQNHRVVFDVANSRVGFTRELCN